MKDHKFPTYTERNLVNRSQTNFYDETASELSLGIVQQTDFMFVGPRKPDIAGGWRIDLSNANQQFGGFEDGVEGRRAGWYSLAFMLRKAAASWLDIHPQELTAGIHSALHGETPITFAFLADQLENGAGFSTFLGEKPNFEQLLRRTKTMIHEDFMTQEHMNLCGGSCYKCLRDYQNMSLHPLLDWRLGASLLELLEGAEPKLDLEVMCRLSENWVSGFGGELGTYDDSPYMIHDKGGHSPSIIVPTHPFEGVAAQWGTERTTGLFLELTDRYPDHAILFCDTFILDRAPASVLGRLHELA